MSRVPLYDTMSTFSRRALIGAAIAAPVLTTFNAARPTGTSSTVPRKVLNAPVATGADQTSELNTAIEEASALGVWLVLQGAYLIGDSLRLLDGSLLDGSQSTVQMSADRKPALRATSKSSIRLRGVTVLGKTSDYANDSGIYAAAGLYLDGTSRDVVVEDCTFSGVAGAGVFMAGDVSDVHIRHCRMTGAGPTYITSTTFNFSGGVATNTGTRNWSVKDSDISGFAQGIVTGEGMADVRIEGNLIHDIPGQHGLYLEGVDCGVVANNIIRDTGLLGMKVQIATTAHPDPDGILIEGNVFKGCGDSGILLTNTTSGSNRVRNTIVSGNVIVGATGDGIQLIKADSVILSDNLVTGARSGVRMTDCSNITVDGGRFKELTASGVVVNSSTDVTVDSIHVQGPGTSDTPSDQFGLLIGGASSSRVVVTGCRFVDPTASHMRYGIFLGAGVSVTMEFTDNVVEGAAAHGWRMSTPAAAVKAFRGNVFNGTLGPFNTPPSNFTPIADATDAASAITQLNAALAVLRNNGIIR